jgi:hypothetical protein
MHGLRELLLPLAALQGASERDRGLIATLELAALSGQPVVLPPRTGRVSLRVKQATFEASERARLYQRWCAERPAVLDPEARATELDWPFWEELPDLGEVVSVAGQRYCCLDILRESAEDGSEGDSLILALALNDDEPDLD